jgi:hypothetical protein
MKIFPKKPDFRTIEIRGFKQDAFADQFHQFGGMGNGNYLLAAVGTCPDLNVGQVNIVKPTLKKMVMGLLIDKMVTAAVRAFL